MKFCIIGPDRRRRTELMLIEQAKKIFDSVLYIPYSSLFMTVGGETKVSYKNTDLSSFDAFLPRITKNRSVFGYMLCKTLKSYSPIKSQSFLMTSDKMLLMSILQKEGIETPKMFFINSADAIPNIIRKGGADFPVMLRMSFRNRDAMLANNEKEAKSIMDTFRKFKSPVYLEELKKRKFKQAYVVGESVVACIEKNPKRKIDMLTKALKAKKSKISKADRDLAVRAAKALKTDFAMIEIMDNKVIGVSLCPSLSSVSRITGVDIAKELLFYIKNRTTPEEKHISWISKILDEIKDIFD